MLGALASKAFVADVIMSSLYCWHGVTIVITVRMWAFQMSHGFKFHGFNIGLHLHGFLMVFVGPQENPSHAISGLRMFRATMDYC